MRAIRIPGALALVALAALLAGCGGGGSKSTSPPPTTLTKYDEHEPNDFLPQALDTLTGAVDDSVSATASDIQDVDLYSAVLPAAAKLYVRADWGATGDLELAISNSDGIMVRKVRAGATPDECALQVPAGQYLVRVNSLGGNVKYTLKVGRR